MPPGTHDRTGARRRWWSVLSALLLLSSSATGGILPDTGQDTCYDFTKEIPCPAAGEDFFGQDGNFTLPPPSYTKLDAKGKDLPMDAPTWSMVRDNVTGLIWEVKTDDGSIHDRDRTFYWYDPADPYPGYSGSPPPALDDTEEFIAALNAEQFGGFTDWRLPSITELATLINSGKSPAIDAGLFPGIISKPDSPTFYWSATANAAAVLNADPLRQYAWGVNFDGGFIQSGMSGFNAKGWETDTDDVPGGRNYVLAVRGERTVPFLVDNGDGTVTDTARGLMWQKATAGDVGAQGMNWRDALAYCGNLHLAGYADWRLPSRNEMLGILDYTLPSAVDLGLFPSGGSYYWTSTTSFNGPMSAYAFFLGGDPGNTAVNVGETYVKMKNQPQYFRAVRTIVIQGDVNGDRKIDLRDAIFSLMALARAEPPTGIGKAADVDGDGRIGLAEAMFALETAAGLERPAGQAPPPAAN